MLWSFPRHSGQWLATSVIKCAHQLVLAALRQIAIGIDAIANLLTRTLEFLTDRIAVLVLVHNADEIAAVGFLFHRQRFKGSPFGAVALSVLRFGPILRA